MRLRGGRLKRRIGVDMGSWEYVAVTCKEGDIISIAASTVDGEDFSFYLVKSQDVEIALSTHIPTGFNSRRAVWAQVRTNRVDSKFTVTDADTIYIFIDNQHDNASSKSVDVEIRVEHAGQ